MRHELVAKLASIFVCLSLSIASPALGQVTEAALSIKATELNENTTALDAYVQSPDDSYAWKVVAKQSFPGLNAYVIDLTSQTWLTKDVVNRTVWKHWVTVLVPQAAKTDTAMLFIEGGSNGNAAPKQPDPLALQVALATGSVVASVGQIPNQPLVFHDDGVERKEDDLIGYTWDQFIKTGDELWPARLPMTKAVVRAMDCVQELSAQDDFEAEPIKQFVVAGGSKRGWTTWTTAVVDKRVRAIAPIVIDVLNTNLSMKHHYESYGFWAPAIGDYVHHKVTHRRHHPRYEELLQLVDPFAYRDRLTMPKCIINATGDQFFVPDSSRFYFDELAGEKYLCYVPNGEHSLRGTNAVDTLAAFHHAVINDIKRPEFTWDFPAPNCIQVNCISDPKRVLLWQATNPNARDFRVDTIGRAYQSVEVKKGADGTWKGEVSEPEEGWKAFLVQLEFDTGGPKPLRLTTPVRIVPDVLPFAGKMAPAIPASSG